eukprot:comp10061_c0_seq1/m.4921 comp10061_c0_seq1/g.4921  ORF comp10061_c0_seq1/g.4921 comp10061_c0_seq1/m.4921 type:complete len:304 (+) comp10061_c0_seq1:776-1687(+)
MVLFWPLPASSIDTFFENASKRGVLGLEIWSISLLPTLSSLLLPGFFIPPTLLGWLPDFFVDILVFGVEPPFSFNFCVEPPLWSEFSSGSIGSEVGGAVSASESDMSLLRRSRLEISLSCLSICSWRICCAMILSLSVRGLSGSNFDFLTSFLWASPSCPLTIDARGFLPASSTDLAPILLFGRGGAQGTLVVGGGVGCWGTGEGERNVGGGGLRGGLGVGSLSFSSPSASSSLISVYLDADWSCPSPLSTASIGLTHSSSHGWAITTTYEGLPSSPVCMYAIASAHLHSPLSERMRNRTLIL